MQIYLSKNKQSFNSRKNAISLQACTSSQDCHYCTLSKDDSLRHLSKTLTGNEDVRLAHQLPTCAFNTKIKSWQ